MEKELSQEDKGDQQQVDKKNVFIISYNFGKSNQDTNKNGTESVQEESALVRCGTKVNSINCQ